MLDLTNRVAIVTGANQGIGLEISKALAEQGCTIAMLDLSLGDGSSVAEVAAINGGKAKGFICNVAQTESVATAFAQVIETFEKVDILVNNAGITRDGLMMRMKDEDFDAVIAVNMRSVFICTREISKHMMKNRYGRIVNMASINGLRPPAGQANYGASKAGVIALTRSSAKELATRGITVNAVAPGFIATAMTDKLAPETREKYKEAIPMRELGSVRDVANAVVFLASEEASYITAQVLSVDGGLNA